MKMLLVLSLIMSSVFASASEIAKEKRMATKSSEQKTQEKKSGKTKINHRHLGETKKAGEKAKTKQKN